jgi:predicted metal-dependent hydrolase
MAGNALTGLPHHTVRESRRARYVRLRFSVRGELEVVVPAGFDLARLSALLHEKRSWIERTAERLRRDGRVVPHTGQPSPPMTLTLRAISETWDVTYRPRDARALLHEHPDRRLTLHTDPADTARYQTALRRWLLHKGKRHLLPWLMTVSEELDLPFQSARVRGSSTRWGSCSGRKTISLSYKLLFLPQHLVRHVLIHELCHTVHLDHSPRFWALVARAEPDFLHRRSELRGAWRHVPSWLDM